MRKEKITVRAKISGGVHALTGIKLVKGKVYEIPIECFGTGEIFEVINIMPEEMAIPEIQDAPADDDGEPAA